MAQYDNIRALERRVRFLEQELAKRPLKVKGGGAANPVWTLGIVGGNTLSDGVTPGIKYVSSVAAVPSAYDPNVDTVFIDGIGTATLYTDGSAGTGYVLVVHDSRSGGVTDCLIGSSDICLASSTTVQIPVSGDPDGATVTCYVPITP